MNGFFRGQQLLPVRKTFDITFIYQFFSFNFIIGSLVGLF